MVKDQDNQRNSEYLNGQKPIFGQGPWNWRSSEMKGLAKSRLKQSLSKVQPRAGSELALIPNETNSSLTQELSKIFGI
jgi:hypothetical protein